MPARIRSSVLVMAVAACNPAGSSAAGTTTTASSAAPSATTRTSARQAPFTCFAWVHQMASSTDCYRSAALCEEERRRMKDGARDPAPCRPQEQAWCTVLRPDAGADERCFGDGGACARYRAMVGSRGISTTACEAR